jgi:DNA-binding transcriptional MocR family regulator
MSELETLSARLMDLAARGETVTYGALAQSLGLRLAVLTEALEALMEEDAAAHRPFRAVMLEAKLTPGLPAPGFFQKAAALGAEIEDPLSFVMAERKALMCR